MPTDAVDATDGGQSDSDVTATDSDDADEPATGARKVAVPLRVYKSVTVFSTLFAVVTVLGGFVLLDQATNRARLPASQVDLPLAALGLASILLGALVYAYSTRFHATGMGTPKDDAGEDDDNG